MKRTVSITVWAFTGLFGWLGLYELLLFLVEWLPFVKVDWRGWLVAFGMPVEITLAAVSASVPAACLVLAMRGKLPGTRRVTAVHEQYWKCPACGYDMSSIKSDLCPECGESLSMMRNR